MPTQTELEARDNIRVAVKASLMFDLFQPYRTWANKYNQSTMPIEVDSTLFDIANDTIDMHKGWHPWFSTGRKIDTSVAIIQILEAVKFYHKKDYQNASNFAETSLDKLAQIARTIQEQTEDSLLSVKKSLMGKDAV